LSDATPSSHSARGALTATASFLLWGVLPVYWKQVETIPAYELIAHRIVWSLVFLLAVLAHRRAFAALRAPFVQPRLFALNLLSSVLLAANWTIYIWAVINGHIIETSLGYFLTPLCQVALGCLLLRERLRRPQWAAIGLAVLGVGMLLLRVGRVPWIALALAATWTSYGFLKKKSALGPLVGLTVETLILLPAAAAVLLWRAHTGEGALGRVDAWHEVLLLSAGVVTAVPLLLFADGAQRIRMTTLGLLQYLAPTLQFLIGLLVYREAFDTHQLQAFAFIWAGLALYSADSFWAQRRLLLKSGGVA
jgi:chloramphenicol-sensitive protein RarD